MKKNRLALIRCLFCLFAYPAYSQTTMVCNDFVNIALAESCTHTITAGEILEGGPYYPFDHYLVDIDKIPPYGNGPWVPATVDLADLGKTYMVRVTEPMTNNRCWGNVKIGTHLACSGITTISLDANGTAIPNLSLVQVTTSDACTPGNLMTLTQVGSATFDCSQLGVQTLQLTATDQSNNTASCTVPVVINDPLGACSSCVTCPPATTVSFQQAIDVLIPALQSGDFSPFDAFGGASYQTGCNITDSTYTVDYQPSTLNESWFIREWTGRDNSGQEVGKCLQPVFFSFDQKISVTGTVFVDSIENCQRDPGERGLAVMQIVATKLPGLEKFSAPVNPDGSYVLNFTTHGVDTTVLVQIELPPGITTPCPNTVAIPILSAVTEYEMDFGIRANAICPAPEISLQTNRLRFCNDNTYYVKYCNKGLAPLTNAYVLVELDTVLELTASTIPWTAVTNNIYTFPLGDLAPLSCGTFELTAHLSCDAQLGQTVCAQAYIYPHARCDTAAWSGPHIEARAQCNGDTVDLSIWNKGAQPMSAPLDFIVIEDVIMYRQGKFQLNAGDSLSLKMPATGATWRIEAQQIPGDPEGDQPSAAVEGCGGLNIPGLINAFPLNDEPAFTDIECRQVVGSYDPNDKSATPTGYGAEHYTRANTDMEYTIRFQNTGTDTAFRVAIADTLSPLLDFASVRAGASSHPYRLDVYEGGILQFVFDPIILPDSNANEPASHGFVTFKVRQQADLPVGSEIRNTAFIYFDNNPPVVTNTVYHTIGAPFVALSASQTHKPGARVVVMPHPVLDHSILQVEGQTFRQGALTLYDMYGRQVRNQFFAGDRCLIERNGLQPGAYCFQLRENGALIATGKLEVF